MIGCAVLACTHIPRSVPVLQRRASAMWTADNMYPVLPWSTVLLVSAPADIGSTNYIRKTIPRPASTPSAGPSNPLSWGNAFMNSSVRLALSLPPADVLSSCPLLTYYLLPTCYPLPTAYRPRSCPAPLLADAASSRSQARGPDVALLPALAFAPQPPPLPGARPQGASRNGSSAAASTSSRNGNGTTPAPARARCGLPARQLPAGSGLAVGCVQLAACRASTGLGCYPALALDHMRAVLFCLRSWRNMLSSSGNGAAAAAPSAPANGAAAGHSDSPTAEEQVRGFWDSLLLATHRIKPFVRRRRSRTQAGRWLSVQLLNVRHCCCLVAERRRRWLVRCRRTRSSAAVWGWTLAELALEPGGVMRSSTATSGLALSCYAPQRKPVRWRLVGAGAVEAETKSRAFHATRRALHGERGTLL
jgi:hypothetical protein